MNEQHRKLLIGADSSDQSAIMLDPATLLRHFMALGSSGSGKTVLSKVVVEEVVRLGIPAICLDPQGDLCSLALASEDPESLAEKGVDPELARAFANNADVVIFTPAARKGVGLSADPIRIDPAQLNERERVRAFTSTATMLASLLGYDLGDDDGEGLVAVFDRALHLLHERGLFPGNLADFAEYWFQLEDVDREIYARYLNEKKIEQAVRKLARLDVGSRRLLFHEGLPLDIDLLLGRGKWAAEGKTRISVIYLNTLNSQEDKEYFVAALTQQLYNWMLNNPSKQPQGLFYIDEVAPFIPPVRKPACKESLILLFKQARKYGLGCLMATQNPGDVDYKAMAQFGTWALGRLTTRQDLKKVQPTVKSLDPVHVDAVMAQLPAQRPGEFIVISPDNFDETRQIRTRWLYSEHDTLDEEAIQQLTDERWRRRFAQPAEPPSSRPRKPDAPQALPAAAEPASGTQQQEQQEQQRARPPAPDPAPQNGGKQPSQHDPKLLARDEVLQGSPTMSASEFAEAAEISPSAARATLKKLVDQGLAGVFKEGRSQRYWSKQGGLRPDLGLTSEIKAIVPLIAEPEAEEIGRAMGSSRLLGVIGSDEELVDKNLEYRPLFRLTFEEKVRHSLWRRLISSTDHEHRLESIYLHPRDLQCVVFHPSDGMFLHPRPEEAASEIEDFDGVAHFEQRLPGELHLNEHEWVDRREEVEVINHFEELYQAKAKSLEVIFLPIWRLHLRTPGQPGARIVTIDALSGHKIDW